MLQLWARHGRLFERYIISSSLQMLLFVVCFVYCIAVDLVIIISGTTMFAVRWELEILSPQDSSSNFRRRQQRDMKNILTREKINLAPKLFSIPLLPPLPAPLRRASALCGNPPFPSHPRA